MSEIRPFSCTGDLAVARFRLAGLAGRQAGVVARHQLVAIGISDTVIRTAVRKAVLHRLLPGVYAVGHLAPSRAGELTAAALYAGPGGMLDGAAAGWWLGLLSRWPPVIDVSTPRRVRDRAGIRTRRRAGVARGWHEGIPVAPVSYVLLTLAATAEVSDEDLCHAIAEAEYRGWLDLELVQPLLRRGRTGAARLRRAIRDYHPQMALLRSAFERRMLKICRAYGIEVPLFNARIGGMTVDALWPEQKVVVELDGRDGHASWARIQRDRRQDLRLRALGYSVLRYVWAQLDIPADIARDVTAALTRVS